jgi:glutathione S-transferase
MIQLHGFALSNYHNKVKFVLLEHGIEFEEVPVHPSQEPALLMHSPLGKVPYIRTDEGDLCESQAIVEYLAQCHPDKPVFPADPFQAAKVRELVTFVELHLELVARELYKEAFFGGKVSDAVKAYIEKRLIHGIDGFKRLAKFSPYLAGGTFTVADIAAFVSLPLVGVATNKIYGRDFLLDAGIDWKAYAKLINEERPAAQRVTDDRNAYIAATMTN